MNEDSIDNLITNLKILSVVKINDKLSIRKGHFHIDNTSLQFIRRWFYKDSREVMLFFINDLIKNIFDLFDKITTYDNYPWILARILTEMENVHHGLTNLKTTYLNDHVIVVCIENFLTKFKELIVMGRNMVLPPKLK